MNLVTDRTQSDVDRWLELSQKGFQNMTDSEQQEWLNGMKGAYKLSDFERVTDFMQYLSNRLKTCGYAPKITIRTWLDGEILKTTDLNNYANSVKNLRSQFAVLSSTPQAPDSIIGITYTQANDIEQILLDVDLLLTNSQESVFYSGEIFSNEVI